MSPPYAALRWLCPKRRGAVLDSASFRVRGKIFASYRAAASLDCGDADQLGAGPNAGAGALA
jgi:hypothetical protein